MFNESLSEDLVWRGLFTKNRKRKTLIKALSGEKTAVKSSIADKKQ